MEQRRKGMSEGENRKNRIEEKLTLNGKDWPMTKRYKRQKTGFSTQRIGRGTQHHKYTHDIRKRCAQNASRYCTLFTGKWCCAVWIKAGKKDEEMMMKKDFFRMLSRRKRWKRGLKIKRHTVDGERRQEKYVNKRLWKPVTAKESQGELCYDQKMFDAINRWLLKQN